VDEWYELQTNLGCRDVGRSREAFRKLGTCSRSGAQLHKQVVERASQPLAVMDRLLFGKIREEMEKKEAWMRIVRVYFILEI
jgi:hypothetical protein